MTSIQGPQDQILVPGALIANQENSPVTPVIRINQHLLQTPLLHNNKAPYFDGEMLCLYANQHSCDQKIQKNITKCQSDDRCCLVFTDIMSLSRASDHVKLSTY